MPAAARCARPRQQLAVVSHIIPTHAQTPRVIRDAASLLQAQNLACNCERAGIRLFAARAFVAV
jgi:3-isopropylmalate/(R)-2-methylmalate dehydratase large subunit